jgi:hypothetical protein
MSSVASRAVNFPLYGMAQKCPDVEENCTEMRQVMSVPLSIILKQRAEVNRENQYNVEGSEISVEIILWLDGRE